jgi:uncharacterized membrane protein
MRVLKVTLLTLDAIVMLCVGAFIGAMIAVPNERSFTNEIAINAPADAVWSVINDREHFAEWQTDLKGVDVEDDAHWIEYPKNSPEPLRFALIEDDRPSSMTFEYTMGDMFQGSWRGDVTPTAEGVRLKTHDSYRSNGNVAKVLIAVFFNLDTFAKKWNASLKQRTESLYQ